MAFDERLAAGPADMLAPGAEVGDVEASPVTHRLRSTGEDETLRGNVVSLTHIYRHSVGSLMHRAAANPKSEVLGRSKGYRSRQYEVPVAFRLQPAALMPPSVADRLAC